MNDIIEEIKKNCPFKTEEELFEYLKKALTGCDLIDFLEKLSCLRFFSLTSFLKYSKTQRNEVRKMFDEGLSFLIPFLLCFKIEEGNEKISYDKIESICQSISYFLFVIGINKKGDGKIDYIQNNLTDLFADFKAIPVGCLLKCEDDLMVQKYGVTSSDLLKELLMVFPNRIFNPKTKIQTFEPSDFIDNFSSIIDTSGFIISKDYKSYNLCDDLSAELGSLGTKEFNASNPLSTINLSRKLFIKKNGILYNLNDDLICGRLNRSVESLFSLPKEKDEWRIKYKEKTESIVKEVFEKYLIGGVYYENNFYKDKNGNFCENDGLFVYHDFAICIEIKGNKFNPDPVNENPEKVENSYKNVLSKAKAQVIRIREEIEQQKSFTIYDSKRKPILHFDNLSTKNIIGICIYFEDIGTYLANFAKESERIIHISFYDLLMVFEFLKNPLLIIKYLFERSEPIKNEKIYLNDEMIFLSLFRNCIHLNSYINDQNFYEQQNIGNIFFPNDEFGMEIELYFMGGRSKPKIMINEFVNRIINIDDYSLIDDNLFTGLFTILCESKEKWEAIEIKFKEKNNSKVRLPIVLSYFNKTGSAFTLMFISQGHNPYQKKQSIAFAKRYFEYRESVNTIYLISVGKDYSNCLKINRQDQFLKDVDDKSLLSDTSFRIVSHTHFLDDEIKD